jgi:hypothetical protein
MTLARVDFNPQDFEDIILQKGYRILWEKVMRCPCLDPTTGRAVQGCPRCDSRGKFYYASSEIKGIITRQDKEAQIGDIMGVLEPGDAFLTTSATNKLSMFDRITNLDSTVVYDEILVHDDKEGDWLRFVPTVVDVAAYQTTRTSDLTFLVKDTDYTVANDGKLSWLTTNKPAHGQGVTFRYQYHPVWTVLDTPNYVRDTFVKLVGGDTNTQLPVRVHIRLEQLGKSVPNT